LIFVIKKIANLKNRCFHPSSYCPGALLRLSGLCTNWNYKRCNTAPAVFQTEEAW